MSLAFVRFRDAVFTTAGYHLNVSEVAPSGLRKSTSAYFVPQDSRGKCVGMELVAGCVATVDGADVFIHLTPYRSNRDRAKALVERCCEQLVGAVGDDKQAREDFGTLLAALICAEVKVAPSAAEQLALVSTLFGHGRVIDMLNRPEAPQADAIPLAEMVAEAFDRQAAPSREVAN